MRPTVALDLNRSVVREAAARFRVANPRVFGSVARATDHDGSDLDLLVDRLPGTSLFELGGLQEELQALLGVRVHVFILADLDLKSRAKVLDEAKPV